MDAISPIDGEMDCLCVAIGSNSIATFAFEMLFALLAFGASGMSISALS